MSNNPTEATPRIPKKSHRKRPPSATFARPPSDDTEESDTDIGTPTSRHFDSDASSVNAHDATPEMTNSSYCMRRIGRKVRRLDLDPSGGGDRTPGGLSRRAPPSTVKKGSVSRVLLSRGIMMEEEEEESPRDVGDFPFDSPERGLKICGDETAVEDENGKFERNGDTDNSESEGVFGRADSVVAEAVVPASSICPPTTIKATATRNLKSLGRANSFLEMFQETQNVSMSPPPSPRCPPTTAKPRRKQRDLSPPKSLKAHGRADSFLQMFRRESLLDSPTADIQDDDDDGYSLKSPDDIDHPSSRQPHSQPTPFSRFVADFQIVGTLGDGSFGSVYKVRNRTDRRLYAIKAAKREARSESQRDRMLREVYALAALTEDTTQAHMHVVGYHQAWMEGNRLYIQTELCDGSLEREMAEGGLADGGRRYKLLREMLLALDLVHRSGMIHLDIKPENIFIKNDQYKLGDFGLVSQIENHNDVEEGDSRYMSMELLSGDLDDLTKSDIFSLGATMYEICLGRPLPENGQEWQDIRHGILQPMNNTAFELQMIVRSMLAPEKESRPSAAELLKKRQLMSQEQQQLIVERNKAKEASMALNQMQRIRSNASPRRRFHRSNTVS